MTTQEKYPIDTIIITKFGNYQIVSYDDTYAYVYSTRINISNGQPVKKGKIAIVSLDKYRIYNPY